MHKFPYPLESGEDPSTGLPVVGLAINGMVIFDPCVSECGRFVVAPSDAYGLSSEDVSCLAQLNALVDTATQAAVNAGCLAIQQELQVPTGDVAGVHFASAPRLAPIAQAMVDYILEEYRIRHG